MKLRLCPGKCIKAVSFARYSLHVVWLIIFSIIFSHNAWILSIKWRANFQKLNLIARRNCKLIHRNILSDAILYKNINRAFNYYLPWSSYRNRKRKFLSISKNVVFEWEFVFGSRKYIKVNIYVWYFKNIRRLVIRWKLSETYRNTKRTVKNE